MKSFYPFLALALSAVTAFAQAPNYSREIFSDDFSGAGFGKRWGHYKSSSVVKDGVLMGITAESSDHPAVDSISFPGEKDLQVSVKFRYMSDKAKGFNVWFDDKNYKETHAGHICSITINPTGVNIADAKTGTFRNDLYEKKKASPNGLSAEEKEFLKKMTKSFPVKLSLNEWHTLVIQTHGDTVSVNIDHKDVASFTSPGVAHETKSLVSLTTNRVDVEYDDFSIKAAAKK
jgi:hypothetical protein